MNILFTRPLIDSEDLMRKLFSMGHKIIHLPTLKISSTKVIDRRRKIWNLKKITSKCLKPKDLK